jgi:hypothetical protein
MSRQDRCLGLWIVSFALVGSMAPAAPGSSASGKDAPVPLAVNKPLAEEQLKLIDQAITDLDRLFKNGEVGIIDPEFNVWTRRRVEALRAAGSEKATIVAALERYVQRLKDTEKYTNALYQKAQTSRLNAIESQYQRLEAEMWLNQEKAR